ncbi:MAG: hypothetical protein IJ213_07585 [Bacteroidales bacterium]|nr:hypothetical protein [Bacteroidales bacterium]MBQ9312887.1 hypothetical protein [Bacteroidales bacterium]
MDNINLEGTVKFLNKHRKFLLVVMIVAAIISAGISLLLPNYYKSQALLLPSAVNSMSKSYLNEGDRLDPYLYGTETESEYILEMLTSWTIMQKVAKQFNLVEHYGVKGGVAQGDRLLMKMEKNIKAKRSDYLGVKLTVWDKDPKYAAEITNYMIKELNVLRNDMKRAKADSIKNCLEVSKQRLLDEIDVLADSLSRLSEQSHIYKPENYADRMAMELGKQVAQGNEAAVQRIERKMDTLAKYGPKLANLVEQLEYKRKNLQTWDAHYEQAVLDLNADVPTDFVVEYASIAGKKDKPKRSLIVLISTLCCTLIAAEYLVIKEKYFSKK